MLTDIEEVVIKELGGLCESCVHSANCVYRKNSQKVVIQCEVFETIGEAGSDHSIGSTSVKGLCSNCNKNHLCHLPKEASGVWHCEEYE